MSDAYERAAEILDREADRVAAIFPEKPKSGRLVSLLYVEEEYRLIASEIRALAEQNKAET